MVNKGSLSASLGFVYRNNNNNLRRISGSKMRILYFQKFIYKEVMNDNILTDCPLVIDGHQFFYSIYEETKLRYEFGAEAKEYARNLLRKPMNMFRKARIKCFFVFKGGDTNINDKIPKLRNDCYYFEANYKYVPPVFLREICLQVLQEIGVLYSTCVAETIDDCVALAQLLGCPVLSLGTEYYFRRVPVILINSLKYSDPNDYILCKEYKLNDFVALYSLTDRKTAIFAALTDIHLFPQNRFVDLFEMWDTTYNSFDLQYKKILNWLSEHTENEALNSIIEFLSSEVDTNKFCNHLDHILKNMNKDHNSVVIDYLYNKYRQSISHRDPLWFEKGVASQKIAIPYINLYKHKFILGSKATESNVPQDSIMLSMDIIKYAYNLLTNFQSTDILVYQDADNYIKVDSQDTAINKPDYECTESVFENGWQDIKHLKLFEYFLNKYNINIDSIDITDDARMLFIALAYYFRKKLADGVIVTKEVYCFIISYAMSIHLSLAYDKYSIIMCKRHDISAYDFVVALNVTKKYFMCDSIEAKNIFDVDVLKPLVELQHCLLHMNYLNVLCGSSYVPTKYHSTFNGTLIYKLLRDMADCESRQFVHNLFRRSPSVLRYVNMLINAFEELITM